MNYQETLDYLYSQLPMYQRIGAAAYKSNLDNTIALDKILNHPHKNFKSIHIAGTNGKGSVSHLIASILQTAGLKVGLYTSPHLKDFRERIRINGEKVTEGFVCNFIETYKSKFEKIELSFFEMTFGMAIQYFSEQKVDIAVMETGMGGRLDSTNILNPILSVITNIGLDHTMFLGDTIEKIAVEKAGIIKFNTPIVIGEKQDKIKSIFEEKARLDKGEISFASDIYSYKNSQFLLGDKAFLQMDVFKENKIFERNLKTSLAGFYQGKNIITTLQSIDVLNQLDYQINKENILAGIEKVVENTGITGRWQLLSKTPLTICDTGHNVDGIREVVKQINSLSCSKLHFVLGMVNDKNIDSVLYLLPKDAIYYFCKANIPRGFDATELCKAAAKFGLTGKVFPSVIKAKQAAQENAKNDDLVFIGGSTFVVAEVV
ncbi:MAG: bifunctional folylpolyglutamate synthase/dihydrofolate synthase [Bacteroidetes bacterium]|nr:bifunctional folylpolyglutamate synthase/dihydrofolate synthase [Bacteroidota bacterium]